MGDKKKQTAKSADRRVALYRKYRSKSLDEIIGQEHITQTLDNAIKRGSISHAYLFTGPRGTGKTSIARILAHQINNIPYEDDSTHLDIIEIDAASNRRIDDIRDLREKVHIAPLAVRYKVYIIDEVHMLTTESFNALLKTLEEPPEHVIFMLATTEVHKLPDTIISRTQRHSLKPIDESKVVNHLRDIATKELIDISDDALKLLAKHGNGSFRDSISLLDQLSSHDTTVSADVVQSLLGVAPIEQLQQLLSSTTNGDTATVINTTKTLLDSGLTPGGIAAQLATLIRDTIQTNRPSRDVIELLSALLDVHGAVYQRLKLESVLLSACPPANITIAHEDSTVQESKNPTIRDSSHTESNKKISSTPAEKHSPPKTNQKPTEAKKNSAQLETEQKDLPLKKTTKAPTDNDITTKWPDILAAIKAKNNPLYTVLRLAHPSVEDERFVLSFSFPFHQKRVDDSKNKVIVAQALTQILGRNLEVETKLDKSLSQPEHVTLPRPPTGDDTPHASVIDSVRDIMGGGEVVDV